MQIIMDEGKIRRDGRYVPESVRRAVDRYMVDALGFKKEGDGLYAGTGDDGDYAKCGVAAQYLSKKKWFADYVDSWLMLNSDESDNPDDYAISDGKRTYFGTVSRAMLDESYAI